MAERDLNYLAAFLDPVNKCRNYQPRMGHTRRTVSIADFLTEYGSDPLYSTVGFATPAVYGAIYANGVHTSVSRQLGIGVRQLVRCILADAFDCTTEAATWRRHGQDIGCVVRLDARSESPPMIALSSWIDSVGHGSYGVAIEVRQGLKTGDGRRQQSYVEANAKDATDQRLLPVLMIMSGQANEAVLTGYQDAGWRVLLGDSVGNGYASSYRFLRGITGFDLLAFFDRHHEEIARRVGGMMSGLLISRASDTAVKVVS